MDAAWDRRVWERKGLSYRAVWLSLAPLSFFYGLGIRIRNLFYFLGWRGVRSLPRTVVSVGNLTVGGTGKTPTTIWLAGELKKLGYRVAILSRGYKRTGKESLVLQPAADSSLAADDADVPAAGDEPAMMARLFGYRVGVGRDRFELGTRILRDGDADVFILDDGFQHRGLKRDIDLLLLGADWNGWLLPAGPFREPRPGLRRANFYLVTGAREKWERPLSRRPRDAVFFGSLQPRALLTSEQGRWKEYPLTMLDRSKILAVSAVADPTPFYRMIHDWQGEIVDTVEFPDHHRYSIRDWQRINRAAHNADIVLTTEKDIIKLARFPFAKERLMALRVEMAVENGTALVAAVERVIREKKNAD
ncbi:MAG TPA: tetraacyldisaccharide 4'-kinase [Candidatus Binatia bacterium]